MKTKGKYTTIPLSEAFSILLNADAVIVNDDALMRPSVSSYEDDDDNEFLYLSWETEGLGYSLKFTEGDNKSVKATQTTLLLLDSDAEKDTDFTEIEILKSYDITTFDPERQFESPDEAIEYANRQPDPLEAAKAIILSNIEVGEYGFASEVTSLLDTM
jgi:hypothetical protein